MEQELNADAKRVLNAYQRAWRKKNPEKVRDVNIRYWLKKAKEEAEKNSK